MTPRETPAEHREPRVGRAAPSLAGRFGLAVASLAVAAAVGEVGVRAAGVTSDRERLPRHFENADKSFGVDAYPANPRGYFQEDLNSASVRETYERRGISGLDPRITGLPYAVPFAYVRPWLLRGDPPTARHAGVRRVVFLGDSFTEGQGVRDEDTFVRSIGRSLRREGLAVETVNFGRRGCDFPRLFRRFEELQSLEPDVVVYAMVLNDPVVTLQGEPPAALNDWIVNRRRALREGPRESRWFVPRLWQLGHERWDGWRVARATERWYRDLYAPANAAGWRETQGFLRQMNAAMLARGGRFVVILLPLMVGLDGDYPFRSVHDEVRRACQHMGVTFRDVLPALRGHSSTSLQVYPWLDMHPNADAHRLIADDVTPLIRETLASLPYD